MSFDSVFGTEYNYMSVMHYSSHGFSVNGEPTIVTHDPQFQDLIGQRASYTADDIDYINLLYSYNEDDQAREIRASKFFILTWGYCQSIDPWTRKNLIAVHVTLSKYLE